MLFTEFQSWCIIALSAVGLAVPFYNEYYSSKGTGMRCIRTTISTIFVHLRACRSHVTRSRHMVDEAQMQCIQYASPYCMLVSAFALSCSLSICMFAEPLAWHSQVDALFFQLGLHLVLVCASYSYFQWTPARYKAGIAAVNCLLFIRICTFDDPSLWMIYGNLRMAIRIITGMLEMDYHRNAFWNVMFFIANTLKWFQVLQDKPEWNPVMFRAVVGEIMASLAVWTICFIAEAWLTQRLHASFDVEVSKTMLSHLLSVFCDFQVELGPRLQITGSHGGLSKILTGSNSFESIDFVQYLLDADKARFKTFIDSSYVAVFSQGTEGRYHRRPNLLPSLLHVRLRDFRGRALPAKIFHSVMMTAERQPRHLIGVCMDIPDPCAPVHSDFMAEHETHSSPTPPQEASTSHPTSSVQGVRVSCPQVLPASHDTVSSEGSSTSSEAPSFLDFMDIILSVDTFEEGMPIKSCTFNFPSPDCLDVLALPKLADWLDAAEFRKLRKSIQECVNDFAYQHVKHSKLQSLAARLSSIEVHAASVDLAIKKGVHPERRKHGPEPSLGHSYLDENEAACLQTKLRLSRFSPNRKLVKALRNSSQKRRARLPMIQE